MIKPVLLDTGCIVALLDRSERSHTRCRNAILETRQVLITCEAVIADACYLVRALPGAGEAILANVASGLFCLPWRLEGHEKQVAQLLRKYNDVPMDFADGCLTAMADEFQVGEILTLDRDFEIYRWSGRKKFKILPS